MTKVKKWDFALRLRGTDPKRLPMADLAVYLKEFAALLGVENKPVFTGIIKGSALLKSDVQTDYPSLILSRIRMAANDESSDGAPHYQRIQALTSKDGLTAQLLDSNKVVLIDFKKNQISEEHEPIVVHDTAELDGQVVSIAGQDDTVHVQLMGAGGRKSSITIRNLTVARDLAKRFRAGMVRIRVHGTWRRSSEGVWEAHNIYADGFEDLEESSPLDVFKALRDVPNNGWLKHENPIKIWEHMRGLHDLHA